MKLFARHYADLLRIGELTTVVLSPFAPRKLRHFRGAKGDTNFCADPNSGSHEPRQGVEWFEARGQKRKARTMNDQGEMGRFSVAIEESVQEQITGDQALKIARLDAEKVYRDLAPYRILIERRQDGWHVDYELKNQHAQGGGPHNVIDATAGAIRSKKYEQ